MILKICERSTECHRLFGLDNVFHVSLIVLFVAVGLLSATLILLFFSIAMARQAERRRNVLRWEGKGSAVLPRSTLADDEFHCFVSHQWDCAQDLAKAMKEEMMAAVPGLRVWLDVDDGIASRNTPSQRPSSPSKLAKDASQSLSQKFRTQVGKNDALVAILAGAQVEGKPSSTYLLSPYCRLELTEAIEAKKEIVFVLETAPEHGGIPFEAHLDAVAGLEDTRIKELLEEHHKQGLIVPWYRVKAYQQLSLRLVLQRIIWATHPSAEMIWANARHAPPMYLPTEPARDEITAFPPPTGATVFHVYVSPNNPGAEQITARVGSFLAERGHQLIVTNDPAKADKAAYFLLYLHHHTWTSGNPRRAELEAECREALRRIREEKKGEKKVSQQRRCQLLLVHERRTNNGQQPATFAAIMKATPEEFCKTRGQGGLYDTLAFDYCGDQHEDTSILLILKKIYPMLQERLGWYARLLLSRRKKVHPSTAPHEIQAKHVHTVFSTAGGSDDEPSPSSGCRKLTIDASASVPDPDAHSAALAGGGALAEMKEQLEAVTSSCACLRTEMAEMKAQVLRSEWRDSSDAATSASASTSTPSRAVGCASRAPTAEIPTSLSEQSMGQPVCFNAHQREAAQGVADRLRFKKQHSAKALASEFAKELQFREHVARFAAGGFDVTVDRGRPERHITKECEEIEVDGRRRESVVNAVASDAEKFTRRGAASPQGSLYRARRLPPLDIETASMKFRASRLRPGTTSRFALSLVIPHRVAPSLDEGAPAAAAPTRVGERKR